MSQPNLGVFVIVERQDMALLFSNYLQSIGIESDVVSTNKLPDEASLEKNQFGILCDLDSLDKARTEFELFLSNPQHERYQSAAWQSGKTYDIVSTTTYGQTFIGSLKDNAGVLTLAALALTWIIFIASYLGFANTIFASLKFAPTLSEPWRLIGPALFHFSWLHLVFNTLWWWMLGGQIEQKIGWPTLLNILLISALCSNAAQYWVSGANFGGLSGVVYALLGYTWWTTWLSPNKGLFISKTIVGFMLVFLLLGYTNIMPVNVANTAHLVGLISGCVLAYLSREKTASQV